MKYDQLTPDQKAQLDAYMGIKRKMARYQADFVHVAAQAEDAANAGAEAILQSLDDDAEIPNAQGVDGATKITVKRAKDELVIVKDMLVVENTSARRAERIKLGGLG